MPDSSVNNTTEEEFKDNWKLMETLSGEDFMVDAGYNVARAAIESIDPNHNNDWFGLWNTILHAVFPAFDDYLIYPPYYQLDSAGNKDRLISEFSVFRLAHGGRKGVLVAGIEPRDYSEKTIIERLDAYLERAMEKPGSWSKIILKATIEGHRGGYRDGDCDDEGEGGDWEDGEAEENELSGSDGQPAAGS